MFEEFSKEFSFYASSTMTSFFFFFLGAMSEKGILKENSVAVIKRKFTTYKGSFMWKKPSAESEVRQRLGNRFTQTYVKDMLKYIFHKVLWI